MDLFGIAQQEDEDESTQVYLKSFDKKSKETCPQEQTLCLTK